MSPAPQGALKPADVSARDCLSTIKQTVQSNLEDASLVQGPIEAWRIDLGGLRGGHSGVDIHEERGSAIKLLVRVLRDLERRWPLRLADLHGGTARNALPREASATVALPGRQVLRMSFSVTTPVISSGLLE